jgi:hypothetical protein
MSRQRGLNALISKRVRKIIVTICACTVSALTLMFWVSGVSTSERQFSTWITWAPEALLPSLIQKANFWSVLRFSLNPSAVGLFGL